MKYRNTRTGHVITINGILKGKEWEKVTEPAYEPKEEIIEPVEEPIEEPEVIEKPKKRKGKRK